MAFAEELLKSDGSPDVGLLVRPPVKRAREPAHEEGEVASEEIGLLPSNVVLRLLDSGNELDIEVLPAAQERVRPVVPGAREAKEIKVGLAKPEVSDPARTACRAPTHLEEPHVLP